MLVCWLVLQKAPLGPHVPDMPQMRMPGLRGLPPSTVLRLVSGAPGTLRSVTDTVPVCGGTCTVREGRGQHVNTSSSTCGHVCGLATPSRPPWMWSRGSCVPTGAVCRTLICPGRLLQGPLQADSSRLAVPSPDAACS